MKDAKCGQCLYFDYKNLQGKSILADCEVYSFTRRRCDKACRNYKPRGKEIGDKREEVSVFGQK